jgi:hypothetical protein
MASGSETRASLDADDERILGERERDASTRAQFGSAARVLT